MGLIACGLKKIISERKLKTVDITVFSLFYMDSEYHMGNYSNLIHFYIQRLKKIKVELLFSMMGAKDFTIKEEEYQMKYNPVNRLWVPSTLEQLILYFLEKGYTFDI